MASNAEVGRQGIIDRAMRFRNHPASRRLLASVVDGERKFFGETKGQRAARLRSRRFNNALATVVSGDRNSDLRDEALEHVMGEIHHYERRILSPSSRNGITCEITFVALDKYAGEPSDAFFPGDDAQAHVDKTGAATDQNVIFTGQKLDEEETATPEDIAARIRKQNELFVELEYYERLTPEYDAYGERHAKEIADLY